MSFFKKKKYVMIGEDKSQQEKINKLECLVGFLCRYNRDDVVVKADYDYLPSYTGYMKFRAIYIANDNVKEVNLGCHHKDETAEVTFNKKHMAIVRIGEKHLMIDKSQGTVTDISDLYVGGEEEENTNDNQG